jgi:hypothetical protein
MRHRRASSAIRRIYAALIACLLTAGVAHADAARTHRQRLGRNLLISGGVLLAAGWIASLGISLASLGIGSLCGTEQGKCSSSATPLWGLFPVVGPWVQVGYFHSTADSALTFAVPGLVQAGGLALAIAGGVLRYKDTGTDTGSSVPTIDVQTSRNGAVVVVRGRF